MECHLLCLHLFISLIKFINVYRIYHLNNVDISLYIKNWPSIYFQAYLTSNTDVISDITKAIFHLKWSASIEYISLGVFPCVKQSTIAYKRGFYENIWTIFSNRIFSSQCIDVRDEFKWSKCKMYNKIWSTFLRKLKMKQCMNHYIISISRRQRQYFFNLRLLLCNKGIIDWKYN